MNASAAPLLDLVSARRGHFQLESGYHGALWLDLDPLFCDARRRIAIVDDVMSAGSALRGTATEVRAHGGEVAVAGALLVLGRAGEDHFAEQGIPVVASARDDYTLWAPADCPLCATGTPLERP